MNKQEAMERLFESIYNYVAPAQGESQKSFYSQLKAGLMAQELSDKAAAQFADFVPAVQRDYVSTVRVSECYEKILSAVLPEREPDEEKDKKYEQMCALVSSDNPSYQVYKNAHREYEKACRKYFSLLNDSNSDEIALMEAKSEKQDKYDEIIGNQGDEIQAALNFITEYTSFNPRAVFGRAARRFREVLEDSTTMGYFPVDFIPGSWRDAKKLSWESVSFSISEQKMRLSSEAKRTTFSENAQYTKGWWFWKNEDQRSRTMQTALQSANANMTTEDLSLDMDIAIVEISRPWFNTSLLSYKGAQLEHEDAGAICSGTLDGEGIMQLIPSAFVLVRNVVVYNQFSEEEKSMVREVINEQSNDLHFGPFQVEGKNTSIGDELSPEEHEKHGDTVRLDLGSSVQILGIVSTVASPKFPYRAWE